MLKVKFYSIYKYNRFHHAFACRSEKNMLWIQSLNFLKCAELSGHQLFTLTQAFKTNWITVLLVRNTAWKPVSVLGYLSVMERQGMWSKFGSEANVLYRKYTRHLYRVLIVWHLYRALFLVNISHWLRILHDITSPGNIISSQSFTTFFWSLLAQGAFPCVCLSFGFCSIRPRYQAPFSVPLESLFYSL